MDYCSNEVVFKGDNVKRILDHFRAFGDKAPPFLDTAVHRGKVKFKSPWTPPIRDLNAIAERFDVSYTLIYQTAGKPTESVSYTCLQHEPVSEAAERIRNVINNLSSEDDLRNAELLVGELFYHRTLDLHDLGVIACLIKRQSFRIDRPIETDNITRRPWEPNESSTERTKDTQEPEQDTRNKRGR